MLLHRTENESDQLGAVELYRAHLPYRCDEVFNAETYFAFLGKIARRCRRQGAVRIQGNALHHKDDGRGRDQEVRPVVLAETGKLGGAVAEAEEAGLEGLAHPSDSGPRRCRGKLPALYSDGILHFG